MAVEVNGVRVPFIPVGDVEALKKEGAGLKLPEFGARFEEVFRGELEKVKFSNHA